MKISLSMWSVHAHWYDGRWDVVDFINFAATTKATGVELLSIFWRDKVKELPRVEEALRNYNLKVACYSACNNFVSADPLVRQAQVKEVTDSVDMAVHFGAPVVRVFSGDLPNDQITYAEGLNYVIEGLSAAAKYAEAKGIILTLENHGLFAGRSDQVLDVIHKVNSSALRSTFDTGNFLLVGQSPSEAITELRDYVKHVHVKDFIVVDEGTPGQLLKSLTGVYYLGKIAGEGEVDLPFIFKQLEDIRYDGWITVEFEGSEEPVKGSIRAVDYVDQILMGKSPAN